MISACEMINQELEYEITNSNLTKMKKLNKLEINSEKLMKNEELMTLRGGYGTYSCYQEGWIPSCYHFITYINTASCDMALQICNTGFGGSCVTGDDCY